MGLGLTRTGKHLVCASATTYQQRLDGVGGLIFDVNAMFRKLGVYPATVTPKTAVWLFFSRMVDPYTNCNFVGFYCDTSSKVPQERVRFLRDDRYAPNQRLPQPGQVRVEGRNYSVGTEPIHDNEIDLITADNMPAPWARVWNSARGKARLWDQLCDCIIDYIQERAAQGVQYVVSKPCGDTWGYPAQSASLAHHFGEADAKCAEAAKELAGSHPDRLYLVVTIDWDMLISAMFFPPNVSVHIANVFVNPDDPDATVYYTRAKAPKGSISIPEILNSGQLGPYSGARAGMAWWLLATAGVDYCDGLRKFGFKEKAMLAKLGSPKIQEFVVVSTEPPRTVTLDLTACLQMLADVRRVLIKSDTITDFNTELDRIWYCLLYYLGLEPQRQPRGGPVCESHTWVPPEWGATITNVLQHSDFGTKETRCVTYTEPPENADLQPRYQMSV
jgi:hypothetical protein